MKKEEVLLILEDNSYELENYLLLARKAGFTPYGVGNIEAARYFLENRRIDVLLCDVFLSSKEPNGLDFIKEARELHTSLLTLVMSSNPDIKIYQEAMKNGALFALKKPLINADEIAIAVKAAKEKRVLKNFQSKDKHTLPAHLTELCEDGLCLEPVVRKWIRVASDTPELPVVIHGETGTGKEEIAKLIAKYRRKKEGEIPFLSVNCALLDGDLAQSLLFGHKKGSFSGACTTTQGFIGEAHGGILFLDEIHTLPLSCQQKLLRVLNDGVYNRIGETKELYSKFQVVVASTQDLDDAVDKGRFLLDLRVRLTGCDIFLSSLRDRMADLPLLVELFFAKQGVKISHSELLPIIDKCREYYWQGNIRQLYQCLRALLAISHADGTHPLASNLPDLKTMRAPRR